MRKTIKTAAVLHTNPTFHPTFYSPLKNVYARATKKKAKDSRYQRSSDSTALLPRPNKQWTSRRARARGPEKARIKKNTETGTEGEREREEREPRYISRANYSPAAFKRFVLSLSLAEDGRN